MLIKASIDNKPYYEATKPIRLVSKPQADWIFKSFFYN